MKKIFSLFAMLCIIICAQAQVLFLNPEGNACNDGSTINIYAKLDPVWHELQCESPSLKNTGAQTVNVSLGINIKALPENTSVADCFIGECVNYKTTGSHNTATKQLAAGEEILTQVEWSSWNGTENVEGQATVEFTVYVNGQKDKVVTVNYIYSTTDGISNIPVSVTRSEAYNLNGQRVTDNTKGLVITNGKKIIRK